MSNLRMQSHILNRELPAGKVGTKALDMCPYSHVIQEGKLTSETDGILLLAIFLP